MQASELFQQLGSTPEGLNEAEVEKRLQKYGKNILKVTKQKSWLREFFEEFTDLMVIILIIAALFAAFSGDLTDAGVILFIVILNAVIGFVQKYKAEKALEALNKMIAPKARVIRSGKEQTIDASLIVPGDLLVLNEGDQIPADAKLVEEFEIECQEATLTGESIPVPKNTEILNLKAKIPAIEDKNRIFMGTTVSHGSGKAIVISTGMKTEFGKIADLTVSTSKDKSPLQKELNRIGIFVGKVTLVISGILLIIGITLQGTSLVDAILFSASVAVAAVPEGLPATVTIALAIGVQRLARQKAIVKQLSSVETLGSTTVICTDKTGTLTKNEMTVKELHFGTYEASVNGAGYHPTGTIDIHCPDKATITIGVMDKFYSDYAIHKKNLDELQSDHPKIYNPLEMLMHIGGVCNNAKLEIAETSTEMLGDPTEGAILTAAAKSGFAQEEVLAKHTIMHQIPFDSTRKRMAVIARNQETKKIYSYVKGAPDEIIEKCSHVMINNRITKIDYKIKKEIFAKNAAMAERALRVIGFAFKEMPENAIKDKYSKEEAEENLVYVGMMGMIDPPRPEVQDAIYTAKKAGIKIFVLTGDHGLTAQAIGKQLDIISDKRNYQIVTGQQLNEMEDPELQEILNTKDLDVIFARVSPEHKLRVVTLLKHKGEIVAVTGDGVNDAPALKRADIGIAMGITGTDVSKEAANMILTEDSFANIVSAIKEGRTIYRNLKKFIFYIFSCNIGELFTIFIAIILGLPAPLTAVLILTVDLGTDVLPALALGIDPPEPGIMKKKPRDPKKHIMEKNFIGKFVFNGVAIGIIVTSVFLYNLIEGGWTWGTELARDSQLYLESSTLAFAILVLIQMVNAYNARSESKSVFQKGFFNNLYLAGAILISLVIVVAVVELPILQKAMNTTHLPPEKWALIAVGSLGILVVEEARKGIKRLLKQAK